MRLPLPLIAAIGSLAIPLGVAIALAVTDPSAAQAQPQAPVSLLVDMNEWDINPHYLAVRANQPVRFVVTNSGTDEHRFVVRGMGLEEDAARSDRLLPGATLTVDAVFTTPGTYLVLCTTGGGSHRDAGMVGTLTVTAATADPVVDVPVQVSEYSYSPTLVSTVAGQTTRFHLTAVGEVSHLFVIRGHGLDMRSPTVRPGEPVAWDVTFAEAGAYEIYCPFTLGGLHSDLGMIGTLSVLPGGGGGAM